MKSYLQRFRQMVQELEEHPSVQITHFHTFPPVTEDIIRQAEDALGCTLDSNILEFYQQTNGLQLIWIFKSNEQYDEAEHQKQTEPLSFDRQYYDYFPEDGVIMIRPLDDVFSKDWDGQIYFDFMTDNDSETFMNQSYGLRSFSKKIKPFDCFNKYYDMAFFLDGTGNPPVILGDDHQACYTDSKVTDFESYMEFVLANKGIISKRKEFYGMYAGHAQPKLHTPESYWTSENQVDIDTILLKDIFPMSDQGGANTSSINSALMQQMAQSSDSLTKAGLRDMLEKHHQFLGSGGAGGRWQTVQVSGLVLGIYTGSEAQEGEQASWDRKLIPPKIDFTEMILPFANFCGCYAKRVDFSEADLSHSLFTDSMLDESIFAETSLSGVDFSRASLINASFMNADLTGADFENCNLTGADFRGAKLDGSRFPGAILKGVKY